MLLIVLITFLLFILTKKFIGKRTYTTERTGVNATEKKLAGKNLLLLYVSMGILLCISLLPHISIILSSLAQKWFFTVFPSEYTLKFYKTVFTHHLTKTGI